MPLRRRIGLLTALAVGITVLAASLVTYAVVRAELRHQVDEALTAQAALARRAARQDPSFPSVPAGTPGGTRVPLPPASFGAPTAIQILGPARKVARLPSSQVTIAVTARDRAVQTGAAPFFSDRDAGSTRLRVYTFSPRRGVAVQLARSVNGVNNVLARLRLVLGAALLLAVLAGGLLGRLFANRALRPVAELTDAVEHVELTGDLSPRITVDARGERDEVARLGGRFNAMLGRLQTSRAELEAAAESQRQLITDASHELRTPVTSLRTNSEVLRAQPELPADQRSEILDDVVAQADELGLLVADLIELAREGEAPSAADLEEVRLDELAAEAVTRARRHASGVVFDLQTEPAVVEADRERLCRAVNNLLENAVKHGPPSGPVDVRVTKDGTVTVRDHGPGVADRDREHVFDRFWRATEARGRPGSGLGLAIVAQVAVSHGGTVAVEEAPGGGALFRLKLPVAA
ncbi:MAG: HAMP domain-containing sensor histidine kinase [Solirubrobacteraceae bacterium]